MAPRNSRALSRRRLLVAAGAVGAGASLGGCTDGGSESDTTADGDGATDGDDTDADGDEDDDSEAADGTTTDGDDDSDTDSDGGELDLREANVVGVEIDRDGGAYAFDVSLHHDDDGEDGYADWWQVERLDGARLGRRELGHPHSQQPFTRSETIDVPESVTCVVVRGHDQTHGYGGVASVVDLESGEEARIDQGSEKQSFGTDDCPE
jgi:hypothetical protein